MKCTWGHDLDVVKVSNSLQLPVAGDEIISDCRNRSGKHQIVFRMSHYPDTATVSEVRWAVSASAENTASRTSGSTLSRNQVLASVRVTSPISTSEIQSSKRSFSQAC